MEIISLKHMGKVVYDRFSLGFSTSDDNLLLIDQYHKSNRFSITLQEYELSKELIIWLSSDLFSELQFDDLWLIFSRLEKARVKIVFDELKTRLPKIFHPNTPNFFRQDFYRLIDELKEESMTTRESPVAA